MKKSILIGQIENEIYTAELDMEDGEPQHFSICGTGYRLPFFNEEDGKRQANESLEEGELWRIAVDAGRTEESLADFVDNVVRNDCWKSVLGDITQIGSEDLYIQEGSGGQCLEEILNPERFKEVILPKLTLEETKILYRVWSGKSKEELHLKNMKDIFKNKKQAKLLHEVLMIFESKKAFDIEDLKEYEEYNDI